jgi:hypothetical protein
VARAEGTGCQLARILFFWHSKSQDICHTRERPKSEET